MKRTVTEQPTFRAAVAGPAVSGCAPWPPQDVCADAQFSDRSELIKIPG